MIVGAGAKANLTFGVQPHEVAWLRVDWGQILLVFGLGRHEFLSSYGDPIVRLG